MNLALTTKIRSHLLTQLTPSAARTVLAGHAQVKPGATLVFVQIWFPEQRPVTHCSEEK